MRLCLCACLCLCVCVCVWCRVAGRLEGTDTVYQDTTPLPGPGAVARREWAVTRELCRLVGEEGAWKTCTPGDLVRVAFAKNEALLMAQRVPPLPHTHTRIHAHTHSHTRAHTHMHTYTRARVSTNVNINTHTRTHTHTHTH